MILGVEDPSSLEIDEESKPNMKIVLPIVSQSYSYTLH